MWRPTEIGWPERRTLMTVLALAFVLGACGGDEPPSGPNPNPNPNPQTGFIQVSTATSGGDLDPDGYTTSMDGNSGRSIGLNGVITFTDVAVGQHQVELSGLAANCSVSGTNPVTVTVTDNATAQASFAIACQGLPRGSLDLAATTSNNFDPDGFLVRIDGVTVDTLPVNGAVTIDSVAAGSRQLELTGIAANCVVQGQNPRTVSVPDGGTASAAYTVTCTAPPDGRIIFAGLGQTNLRLDVMNADGTGQFTLYPEGTDCCREVAWSPDGSKIAVTLYDQTNTSQIYVMNKDGSGLTRLRTNSSDEFSPAWSPDGSRIAFVSWSGLGMAQILVMNADGSGVTKLTSDPTLHSYDPTWSPDGSKIAFAKGPNGQGDRSIYLMNADGTNVVTLTGPNPICSGGVNQGLPEWGDDNPRWSPDGSRIAFVRNENCDQPNSDPLSPQGPADVLLMDPDGTNMVNLTSGHGTGWETWPRWSPDGSRILFTSETEYLFVMNADGSGRTPLQAGSWSRADWGP